MAERDNRPVRVAMVEAARPAVGENAAEARPTHTGFQRRQSPEIHGTAAHAPQTVHLIGNG